MYFRVFALAVIACVTAILICGSVYAQVVPAVEDAGQIGRRFVPQTRLLSRPRGEGIRLESTEAPSGAATITINIRAIQVEGSTVYSADELAGMTGQLVGQSTVQQIYDLAATLTVRYRQDGYVLSRVIVPPQELVPDDAVIRLQIIEGYVDNVRWPEEVAKYRDYFTAYADKITAQRPLHIKTLERYLLLAGDLPGLEFSSTLEPSKTNTGASTLVVTVKEKPFAASVSTDNRGTEGRGPYQYTVYGSAGNLFNQHESLELIYAGSYQVQELQYFYGRLSHVFNSEGLKGSVTASFNTGEPGTDTLQALAFESDSASITGELSYPVIRSREQNLALSALLFATQVTNDSLGSRLTEDRLRGIRATASFDQYDNLKGVTQLVATFSQGIDGLGSTSNNNPNASRSAGRVDFTKVEGTLARFQSLPAGFSAVARMYGQYAGTPLLSSEECTYGGGTYGRAFEPSVLAGDHCVKLSAELRYDLPIPNNPLSQTQLYTFTDYGAVWQLAPATGSPSHAEASSIGAGVRVGWNDMLAASLETAHRLSGSVGDNDWQVFFNLSATY
ncbi:ShlB/FhaC/HecB family hemolysin secretion/activation protein [Roseibium sp. AS2]|uniref:ShlB/FhaC/HecB family hemolysin secretion/activation protein n=1 Tax=Roseibium sp. AS2 TaxID=3135781 RepID=UPI00316F124D